MQASPAQPGRRARHAQAGAVVLAGLLWAFFPIPTFSALIWAYLVVVLALGLARGRGHRWADLALPWPWALGLGLVLSLPAAVYLARTGRRLWANDQLEGLRPVLQDRLRLTRDPQLHPPVLAADRPQVFWIRAAGARAVSVELDGAGFDASRIADGVFRWVWRPGDSVPTSEEVVLRVDGEPSTRALTVVPPRARPTALAADPEGGALAVSEETDELLLIGSVPGVVERITVGDGPLRAARVGDAVVVAHRGERALWWVGREGPPRRTPVGPGQRDLAVDGDTVWVARTGTAGPGLLALDPGGRRWWPLEAEPERVLARDGQVVVASRVARGLFRVAPEPAPRLALGRPATALAWRGAELVAAVSDLRPEDDAGPNHQVAEQLVRVDVARWRVRGADATAGAGVGQLAAMQGDLLIAFTGSGTLQLAEGRRVASPIPAPDGLVAVAGGRYVVTSAATGQVAWLDREGRALATVALGGEEPPEIELLRAGERAFTEATRSGTSCASCHPGADSDHALHDIGHGVPRPTLSVRGVAGTAPFLRGASYPDLSGLDHFAATILGGYDRALPNRAAALSAYVLSLPLAENPRRLPADVEDTLVPGYRAFQRAGCPACHPPPAFTDLAQIPAQVLFPEQPPGVLLDTPSLLSVSVTAPYLFDGRAPTLASVFEAHDPGERHGAFHRLEPSAQADLLRFLEAL